MRCIFCDKEMVGFHICDSSVPNMPLRPTGLERMGDVTFGETLPPESEKEDPHDQTPSI